MSVATTLGQSAFDYLVDKAVDESLQDGEFDISYGLNQDWVYNSLPDFFLDGWEELTDENREEVVMDLRGKVRESFESNY